MKGIRAITFDVGGTLITPYPSVGHVYSGVARRHGYEKVSPEALNERFSIAWRNKTDFRHTRNQWQWLVNETFAGVITHGPSQQLFDDIYRYFGTAQAWRVYDDVWPTLEKLSRFEVKLGIISNWDERLCPLLRELKLMEHFDCVVVSIDVGATKPDRKIFERAMETLNVSAAAMIHVGDTETEDVLGARAAGAGAILLDRISKTSGPLTIASLTDLEEVLNALR